MNFVLYIEYEGRLNIFLAPFFVFYGVNKEKCE